MTFDWLSIGPPSHRRSALGGLAASAALIGTLLTGSGSALAAPAADVVNVPGISSILKQVPVGPVSGYTRQQTFKPLHTGNLVGIWIAAACDGCGTDVNDFVNVLVSGPNGGILEVPRLSTWEGGNSGNLQYLPLEVPLAVTVGDTVSIRFACSQDAPTCLSSFNLVATGDQYPDGALTELTGTDASVGADDLVFITQMDGIVQAPAPPPPSQPTGPDQPAKVTINDTDPAIRYTGNGWGYYPNRGVGDLSDDVHATLTDNDSVSYTFTGTGISYVTEKSVDEGKVDVSIDGVLQRTVNAYSADHNLANQTLYSLWGLPQGQHTITLTKRGGTYMLLDGFIVRTDGHTINDTDPGLQYSGSGWGYYPGRPTSTGDLQQDVHATLNNGDMVTYTFDGTGISYLTEKSLDEGKVDVYVDGTFQQTVNAYAAGVHNQGGQVLYSKMGLAAGQHTLKLVKHSGQYMLVDALTVLP
jgi:Carbohydrate esterase 2 N-terminal